MDNENYEMAQDGQKLMTEIPGYDATALGTLARTVGSIIALSGEEVTTDWPKIKEAYVHDKPVMPETSEEMKARVAKAVLRLRQAKITLDAYQQWLKGEITHDQCIDQIDQYLANYDYAPIDYFSLVCENGLYV